jgi:hypothetical protein
MTLRELEESTLRALRTPPPPLVRYAAAAETDADTREGVKWHQETSVDPRWKTDDPARYHAMWPHNGSKTTSVATVRAGNGGSWDSSAATQTSLLFVVWRAVPGLAQMVARDGHFALASLAAASQEAFEMVSCHFVSLGGLS